MTTTTTTRIVCECGCFLDGLCCCARDCSNHPGGNDEQRHAAAVLLEVLYQSSPYGFGRTEAAACAAKMAAKLDAEQLEVIVNDLPGCYNCGRKVASANLCRGCYDAGIGEDV